MTFHDTRDAGPDGFGPIDAVVTWVDGSDPDFQARRAATVRRLRREDPNLAQRSDLAFSADRYVQHDEIRYCLRSILNHAPWMRRIWLVTDNQFPASLDGDALDPRITVIDHTTLFGDLSDALPVFNSGAIEVMVASIPGISDRFVLFNDDFFLTKPTTPDDFFHGMKPVLHGKWVELEQPVASWLQRRINSAELFDYGQDRLFKEAHVPYSINALALRAIFERYPNLRERMARRPFRSSDDFYVVGLHNHYCLSTATGVEDTKNSWLVYGSFPENKDRNAVQKDLCRIGSQRFLSTCINNLGSFAAEMPEIYTYLDAGTGSPHAFERSEYEKT